MELLNCTMKQEQIHYYKAAASLGLIPDDENPLFIFNSTNKDLLLGIINGSIDSRRFAMMELENRGLDINTGRFIGWNVRKKKQSPHRMK